MRDHRNEMTEAEREAMERELRDITRSMHQHGPKFQPTPNRAKRRAAAKRAKQSRRRNR